MIPVKKYRFSVVKTECSASHAMYVRKFGIYWRVIFVIRPFFDGLTANPWEHFLAIPDIAVSTGTPSWWMERLERAVLRRGRQIWRERRQEQDRRKQREALRNSAPLYFRPDTSTQEAQ